MGNSGAGVGLGRGVDVGSRVAVGGATVAKSVCGADVTTGEQAARKMMKKMLNSNRFMVFFLFLSFFKWGYSVVAQIPLRG